ncbi:MAG: peroxiredoxin [Rhabdochlamydiaceae bacterium]|nr:peroxiredoxin [Candidatus Amphrikana amoebophyrae]
MIIGKKAPEFCAKAVVESSIIDNFTLQDLEGKYVVFFFYPLDFTFVCPTELHAFQTKLEEFKSRNCEVVGCSIDSHFSHAAWLNTPIKQGGIQGVTYPIVSDINKTISKDFGVLFEEAGIAYRGLFLLDKQGIVRHLLVNDLPLGRSVDEAIRMLDALQYFEENGEVCPANWHKGDKSMQPDSEGLKAYFS